MLYCSFEIVKAMFLSEGEILMILECEKCISLHLYQQYNEWIHFSCIFWI